MYIDTASHSQDVLVAVGTSVTYAYFAMGFAHPDERLMSLLNRQAELPEGAIGKSLARLCKLGLAADLGTLCRCHMRIFDPRREPFPLEAEHRTEHFQQRTAMLADLMGFYRAFGATPNCQRPDHIVCELDFLHFLSLKEAMALDRGKQKEAQICSDARRKFLKEHLLEWYPAIIDLVHSRATESSDDFYLALADGFEVLMEKEKEEIAHE